VWRHRTDSPWRSVQNKEPSRPADHLGGSIRGQWCGDSMARLRTRLFSASQLRSPWVPWIRSRKLPARDTLPSVRSPDSSALPPSPPPRKSNRGTALQGVEPLREPLWIEHRALLLFNILSPPPSRCISNHPLHISTGLIS
jgi:hypothetical protein